MEHIIAVSFGDDNRAAAGLAALEQLSSQGQIDLNEAALRNKDGRIAINDEIPGFRVAGTATVGLVGLLIGILGGPLGILIGGATGLIVGSLFDVHDGVRAESVLSDLSRSVRGDRTTLLADVQEQSPDAVDAAMARLGGVVLRRSLDDVEADIAATADAQHEAKQTAHKFLHERRWEQHKANVRAKVDELKAKMDPGSSVESPTPSSPTAADTRADRT